MGITYAIPISGIGNNGVRTNVHEFRRTMKTSGYTRTQTTAIIDATRALHKLGLNAPQWKICIAP